MKCNILGVMWYIVSSIFVIKCDRHSGVILCGPHDSEVELPASRLHSGLVLNLIIVFTFILSLIYRPGQSGVFNQIIGGYLYAQNLGIQSWAYTWMILLGGSIVKDNYRREDFPSYIEYFYNDCPRILTLVWFPVWALYTLGCIILKKVPCVVTSSYAGIHFPVNTYHLLFFKYYLNPLASCFLFLTFVGIPSFLLNYIIRRYAD